MGAGGTLVDLPEDRGGIADGPPWPAEEAGVGDRNAFWEGNFGSRQQANRHVQVFRRGKAPGSGSKITGEEIVADGGGTGSDVLQAIVAHWVRSCVGDGELPGKLPGTYGARVDGSELPLRCVSFAREGPSKPRRKC